MYTKAEPMPVSIESGSISVDPDTDSAREATQQDVLAALTTPLTTMPPVVPETLNGTNAVLGVKVAQTGAGTASIEALDADELWDVLGWSLSFSAATILTVSVDDDDATRQYAFDVPAAGIWDLNVVDFARFSGNIGEPVGLTITAGNMKGVVYVRKHT